MVYINNDLSIFQDDKNAYQLKMHIVAVIIFSWFFTAYTLILWANFLESIKSKHFLEIDENYAFISNLILKNRKKAAKILLDPVFNKYFLRAHKHVVHQMKRLGIYNQYM